MRFLQRALSTILNSPAILFEKLFLHGVALAISLIYLYLWGFRGDYVFAAFSQAVGIQLVALSAVQLWRSSKENEDERMTEFGKLGLIFLGFQLMGQFLIIGDLVVLAAIPTYCFLSQRYIAKIIANSADNGSVWRMAHAVIAGIGFAILNYQSLKGYDSDVLNLGVAALFAGAIFSKSTELALAKNSGSTTSATTPSPV
jgi:hypothetical protein